ncbi:coenzyme F420-0:L-glutamate ligase [Steroidobacter cummioxidans]|uniref:coenzyme F420-0:L-glutamate ligase n=1 Tax=Steroidobacter cummioxidans TaxID=1803913 RepID=UPI000E30C524|nr:coenzyme F420-0:L-glutamate ligase [Steroidobacter cummioxidans]
MKSVVFTAVPDLPEIQAGQDLSQTIAIAIEAAGVVPAPFDVIVVAQKIVSKAEGRSVDLRTITPSPRALELAMQTRKDARLVEAVLAESQEVMRAVPNVLIVRHRLGFVMANAGIDRSNVPGAAQDQVLLLPQDPDASAERLRNELSARWQVPIAVLISDSFGRAWRNGVVNVAIGAAGLPSIIDRRGEYDREGRALEMTEVALADAIAAGAALVMGEASEGTPVVIARGLRWTATERSAAALLRSKDQDLFR